jgi:hypothetical protein
MRRPFLFIVASATLLVGCTSGGKTEVSPKAPLVAEAAGSRFQRDAVIPENGTAPAAFVDRERLPSCGSYAWTLDEQPPENVWRCLADSRKDGSAAELIVQAPGIDSTAVAYHRATDGGEVEVWWNSPDDARWSRGTCGWVDADERPGPCESVENFEQTETERG